MRKFLIAAGILFAVIVGLFWAFNMPNIPRSVLEAKYATPPSAFVVLPDGARVHYRIRGAKDAPALLLLHGSNASLFTWEPWSKLLSDEFRVVSVDLPGHGLTGPVPGGDYSQEGMAKFVGAFADRIGLKTFALAGNSMGGGVAARFAEEHPDRVTRLILVDAGGLPFKAGEGTPLAFRLARIPVLNRLLLHVTPRAMVREGLDQAIENKKIITDAMIDTYWDLARLEGTRRATLIRFTTPSDTYVRDHTQSLTMPVLILWGERDRLIPVAVARDWKKALPQARLILYRKTGHIPMEEMPKKSAADVRVFLEGK